LDFRDRRTLEGIVGDGRLASNLSWFCHLGALLISGQRNLRPRRSSMNVAKFFRHGKRLLVWLMQILLALTMIPAFSHAAGV
jgi:hypothetical protein